MKLYRFIYYSFFKFCIRLGKKDIPERKAIVLLCLWEWLYLLIPYGLLRHATGLQLSIPKVAIYGWFGILCVVHFFSLINNKRYLRIYREFENDPRYRKTYAFVPFVFLLLPIFIMVVFTFTIWQWGLFAYYVAVGALSLRLISAVVWIRIFRILGLKD